MSSAPPEFPNSQLRVLVADANEATRALYRESLQLAVGCDVVEAGDGRDALVTALVHRPALVITETRLPSLDGYALCEVLRRDAATRTMPILVVTADTRQSDLERARAAGADAVLVKPVAPADLLVEIRRLIAGPAAGETAATPNPSGVAQSHDLLAGVTTEQRRRPLSKMHPRFETTTPPAVPPQQMCPSCGRPLTYERSHIGGVSSRQPEQWDDYTCPAACGMFEYRQRTRKIRPLG
jgi:CheY-like chemotaxis protein